MLDNGYVYLAATRMSLHRSSADWALVIEVFGYNFRASLPDVATYTFGSTIRDRKPAYDSYFPLAAGDWVGTNDVAEGATHVELRGRRVSIPTREAYAIHGIELEDPDHVAVHELCRFLADVARDDVLATRAERRAHVPAELEQLMVLDEWTHPDLASDVHPSDVESFQQLARVLETGDVSLYRPSTPPNTHWKHWPESGTL